VADYFSPTVIQQTIPNADITPLERLLLTRIFSAEPDGDGLYFFADERPADMISVSHAELEAALAGSALADSEVNAHVAAQFAKARTDADEIELDLSGMSWEFILQDIVRRSSTLRYVTAITSFTCSKMRPDGFGGMAALITADAIKGKSTSDILEDFLSQMEDDSPAHQTHVLLDLREHAVREQIGQAIETDPTLTRLTAEAISDADIHAACIAIAAQSELSEERGAAEFRAALAAIGEAERRQAVRGIGGAR
jgi:hypothetical protein